MESDEAWALLAQADKIIATKGKRIHQWFPSAETKVEILDVVIGRSGTLRAPTIRVGESYLIGFDEKVMQELILD